MKTIVALNITLESKMIMPLDLPYIVVLSIWNTGCTELLQEGFKFWMLFRMS